MNLFESSAIGGRYTAIVTGLVLLCGLGVLGGCGPAASSQVDASPEEDELAHPSSTKWTGDLDGMVERRQIRVLTTFNPFGYYIDEAGAEKGATYEAMKMFEEKVNEHFKTGNLKVHIVMIPISRDKIFDWLQEGRGDIASANLTITPERQELVDFSEPWGIDVREVVMTLDSGPTLNSADDLSGLVVTTRKESSYWASLEELNREFEAAGKAPVDLQTAAPFLEDEDLAMMLSTGLIEGALVMDQHKAEPLAKAIGGLKVHTDAALRTGGQIASAFRKGSPKLENFFNDFVKTHKKGTLLGNIIINRYLKDTKRLLNALDQDGKNRFETLKPIFEKYGGEYDLNWLAMIAQGYQESRLDQDVRSHAGAIGVMQLLKSTAADPNVGLPEIEDEETNIHAGIKYMRFIANHYFSDLEDDPWNQAFFCLASYNAGPNRIRRLRAKAAEQGLDPDKWFSNVEIVVAKEVGMEPIRYVSNIYKYFAAYSLYMETLDKKAEAMGA